MSRPRHFSAARSRVNYNKNSRGNHITVSPQRIALEKAYHVDKDDLLNRTMDALNKSIVDPATQHILSRYDAEDMIQAIERNQMKLEGDGAPIEICELLNEKPAAILASIGSEIYSAKIYKLKKDAIKKRMENNMRAFSHSRHSSLVESIKKKADASKFRDSNQELVLSNLLNDEKREKLLDVGLMKEMHIDYLYKKESKLIEQSLNNNKRKTFIGKIQRETQNDETIFPKHIRKNPFSLDPALGITNKIYYLNIDKKKKKMEFIRMAMEVNKQRNFLLDRRKTNQEVLDYLLGFEKTDNKRKNSKEFICLAMLRRIFFRSSHRDIDANQNVMDEEGLKSVFMKLKMCPDYIDIEKASEIFCETTINSGKKTIDSLEFVECVKGAAQFIFDNIEESDMSEFNKNEDLILLKLYDKFIEKGIKEFTLPNHEKLKIARVQKFLEKQESIFEFLFSNFVQSLLGELKPFEDLKEPTISFEKVFEMFTMIGLFPYHCERVQIRYYYDYASTTDEGLDLEDFKLFLPLIGMDIIERFNRVTFLEQSKLKIDPQEIKLYKDPLEMMKHFFESSKFIGSLPSLKRKIMKNEDKFKLAEVDSKKLFYNRNKFNKSLINYMDSNLLL